MDQKNQNGVKGISDSTLELHPLGDTEYIGNVRIEPESVLQSNKSSGIKTVIILDKSSSMGDVTARLAQHIFPIFLSKLGYDESDVVHLITFERYSELQNVKVKSLQSLIMKPGFRTFMANAVTACQKLFNTFPSSSRVRILTISDGAVDDPKETQKFASLLVDLSKEKNLIINSQAVRLFTSGWDPDTKALCSLLQLNNTTTSKLIDVSESESNEAIAEQIKNLFEGDNLGEAQNLTMKSKIIYKLPWDTMPVSQIPLMPGDNLFWLKELPSSSAILDHEVVKTEIQPPLTLATFKALIEDKLYYIVDHMKILKVIGSDKADETIKMMQEYFEKTEETLSVKATSEPEDSLTVNIVSSSTPQVEPSSPMKITAILARIADDDEIAKLSSAQKAKYLRDDQVAELIEEACKNEDESGDQSVVADDSDSLKTKQEVQPAGAQSEKIDENGNNLRHKEAVEAPIQELETGSTWNSFWNILDGLFDFSSSTLNVSSIEKDQESLEEEEVSNDPLDTDITDDNPTLAEIVEKAITSDSIIADVETLRPTVQEDPIQKVETGLATYLFRSIRDSIFNVDSTSVCDCTNECYKNHESLDLKVGGMETLAADITDDKPILADYIETEIEATESNEIVDQHLDENSMNQDSDDALNVTKPDDSSHSELKQTIEKVISKASNFVQEDSSKKGIMIFLMIAAVAVITRRFRVTVPKVF